MKDLKSIAKTRPLISVIIPAYNGERYLAEAIESVLGQTFRSIEVIIVDDGSTDRTAQVVEQFRGQVRYFFHTNRGLAQTRNQGVALGRGDFFAFLDADDLWVRDKLESQLDAFHRNGGLEAVFGHVVQFLSPESAEELADELYCPDKPQPGYHAGTMLIKREAFFRVGLFDPQWDVAEFVSWYIHATEVGLQTLMLPATLMYRRLHHANQSRWKRDQRVEYLRALKASLDRRRNHELGRNKS